MLVKSKDALSCSIVSSLKSKIYVSHNTADEIVEQIKNASGMQVTDDLGLYLGIPLLHKAIGKDTFESLLEKINSRLSVWRGRYLSLAGRITLAKAVISSIPVYFMAVLPLPVSTCEKIDKVMLSFIWGGSEMSRKMHMVDDITKPMEFGGLGIKRMEELNLALFGKLAWRFLHAREELWARAIHSKYIRPSLIERSDLSPVWRAIRRGVGLVIPEGVGDFRGSGRQTWAGVGTISRTYYRMRWFSRLRLWRWGDSGNEVDCITWSRAQNGVYTVSSAYKLQIDKDIAINADYVSFCAGESADLHVIGDSGCHSY
ncbi:hypothetical protein V2J09_011341 [Rumex salicifolius]